jgi:hypothetical protein
MEYLQIAVLIIATTFLIVTLGYGLAYVASLIFNFKIKTPIPVIFTTGCLLAAFIIQSILKQWGFHEKTIYFLISSISIPIVVFAAFYCYLFKKSD